ncbi:pyridoxamine 5'-phosphate oxidase family protein [Rhodococcus sp. NPDC019627]|uniref:pyridoxamine 5'-phosphate oxidase family protein n=1 Tax=unclassified Rhodococcus (in: high G+C Gram-positive bacteria) TaxID=192944 RepID=UPI0033DCE0F2
MYQEKPPVVTTRSDGPLRTAECRELLRSVPTGRLVYTEDALPAVRPVTFAALDGDLVIPTGNNPWFDRFDRGVLAFEAGTIDPATRTGWSVLAMGRSRLLSSADGLIGFADPARLPWSSSRNDRYLVIGIEQISGHRTTLLRPAGDLR